MKKHLYIIILTAIISSGVSAQSSDTLAIRAYNFYTSGQYEEAIDAYKALITAGYESAELYYNLGNAYFKANKISYAILNYERSLRLDPTNEDTKYNLELSKTYIVDEIEELPELFFVRWKKSIHYLFDYNQWAVLSIVLFVIALICFGLYLFTRNLGIKKSGFVIGIILLLLSIYAFTVAHSSYNETKSKNEAIIINPTVTIKGSPDESGTELFVLHEGTKVTIDDKLGDWREIKLSDGNKGWIKIEDLLII